MAYQLHCPKCGHEFAYDNKYYDENIAKLGKEICDINLQIAEHRLLPWPEQKQRTDWWLRAKKAKYEKEKQLGELKAIRKSADQQINAMSYQIFKQLFKEEYGEKEYQKFLSRVEEELKAYEVSGLMRHEYSRARGTNIEKV